MSSFRATSISINYICTPNSIALSVSSGTCRCHINVHAPSLVIYSSSILCVIKESRCPRIFVILNTQFLNVNLIKRHVK